MPFEDPLDPRSRVELWEVLRELVKDGTTLLLTTQYLEEADQLADNIVVIDRGTVIAEGTVDQVRNSKDSITGRYLRGDMEIPTPEARRPRS